MQVLFASAIPALTATSAFAGGHMAASTFQNTCSNITLGYGADGGTMISATCLKADGMPNATSIAVPAIGSTDGTLSN